MTPSALDAIEFPLALSLYAARAATPFGREAIEASRPLSERRAVESVLAETREMLALLDAETAPAVPALSDPRPILDRLGARPLEGKEVAAVAAALRAVEEVRDAFLAAGGAAPRLGERAGAIPDFAELRRRLDRLVEADGSVPDRASPRLARLRREIAGLERDIARRLGALLARASLRPHLRSSEPVVRDGRTLLAVRFGSRGRVRGILHERSASGATVFVEPEEIVEPSGRLADLRVREAREIAVLFAEASREIAARASDVASALAILGALDATRAKARTARELPAAVPAIDEGRLLDLRQARHPLLLAAPSPPGREAEVVPIDVRLGEAYDLLLLTGPNTGGKTVALKTAGLLSALALAGFPIPAREGSRVPVYDAIFADIGDEQEIAQNLSTFSSHLRRLLPAIERATARSLVLLDELGAGTDPAEGAALAEAVLERLLERGVCAIATTHLSPLKTFAYRHARAENASVEFDAETLRPLYRIRVGFPGESNALSVAKRLGADERLLARARDRLAPLSRPHEAEIAGIRERRVEAARSAEETERLREEAEAALERLERAEREAAEARSRLAAEADASIAEAFGVVRERLRAELASLGSLPRPLAERLEAFGRSIEEGLRATPLEERRLAFLRRLRKDDLVYLPRYRRRCPVRRVDFAREVVTVLLGEARLEVPFEEVTWIEPPGGTT